MKRLLIALALAAAAWLLRQRLQRAAGPEGGDRGAAPALPYPPPPPAATWRTLDAGSRLADLEARVRPGLEKELARHGCRWGAAACLRVFKESRELELWLQAGEDWTLFRRYPIAAMSGTLGPKLREGDRQAPEGFYGVTATALNPASRFHLAFNLGYPNAFDRHHQRTGSLIMIHGAEVSTGCFAMTDPLIEEIYLLVAAALAGGQAEVPVHLFPFRPTPERLRRADGPWRAFWRELQPVYAAFERLRRPPRIDIRDGRYRLAEPP